MATFITIFETRNLYFTEIVKQFLEEYKQCGNNKNQKSLVLDNIASVLMKENTQADGNGDARLPARFVRLEPKAKRWYIIEGHKMIISQKIRDLTQEGYKSASTYKNLKRRKPSSSIRGGGRKNVSATESEVVNQGGTGLPPLALPNKTTTEEGNASTIGKVVVSGADLDGEAAVDSNNHGQALPLDLETARSTNTTEGKNKEADDVLSKKEQLERQIEDLKKQLETLDDSGCGKDGVAAAKAQTTSTQDADGPGGIPNVDVVLL